MHKNGRNSKDQGAVLYLNISSRLVHERDMKIRFDDDDEDDDN